MTVPPTEILSKFSAETTSTTKVTNTDTEPVLLPGPEKIEAPKLESAAVLPADSTAACPSDSDGSSGDREFLLKEVCFSGNVQQCSVVTSFLLFAGGRRKSLKFRRRAQVGHLLARLLCINKFI